MKKLKIAALVSGGVDSSVALALLKAQGHDVTAFYLKIWLEDELAYLGDCPWEQDLSYVRAVCEQLGVPLKIISLQKEYSDTVVGYTIAEIKAGRTPNPDIMCNQRIKFGFFLDKIDASFDKVATGHYAQVQERSDGTVRLLRAPDAIKDQTYFLSHLSQEQLQRIIFPIGHLNKAEVRDLAHQFNLPNKDRKDSQGICFLGKLKFTDFVKHHLGERPGNMVEVETGNVMGQHQGFWFYTIGQRQGLRLAGGPWYVVDKDPRNNIVYISRNYHADDKQRKSFTIANCNWTTGQQPIDSTLHIKLRHGAYMHCGTVTYKNDGTAAINLQERDQGIAPGQFAVLYKGDECLGGGVITGM
ncbi:MAG TPA: tRNA 2-thiouridine(34) synthase MnmA [Candidatus Dependentiae bacterium]|nr:tRNA 2-thiouridine(34) synthase MnmA [Candidatus Dependentiae bacterium]HRQ62568.1 tRNA 2-thiouridine(34) synthase MnmA [Candidatus Dependentiae bacterium]